MPESLLHRNVSLTKVDIEVVGANDSGSRAFHGRIGGLFHDRSAANELRPRESRRRDLGLLVASGLSGLSVGAG